jgi:hypothetical protein
MEVLNQQQLLVQALAFLIQNIGYTAKGGRELFFSLQKLQEMSPTGQIQVEQAKDGFHIRYIHNHTIDVEAIKDGSVSGLIQHPQADDSTTTPVVDSVRDLRGGKVSKTDGEETGGPS